MIYDSELKLKNFILYKIITGVNEQNAMQATTSRDKKILCQTKQKSLPCKTSAKCKTSI